ncbi:g3021 [Coccomyxa elongata]
MDLVAQEAVVMKRQRHVNLLELYTSFVWDHYLWMVMPFVSGGSLEVLLRRGYPKGLREVEIAVIMKQVLEALAYLHGRGVLHRDIKASNILVGRDGRVMLSDLGVAAKLERHFSADLHPFAALERRNTFVGSPAYIAPELLTGIDKGYGLPADLYSFGVTLVEAAFGHTPFVDLSFEQIAISKATCDAVPLLAVDAHGTRFSQELGDVVAQCLQRQPDERPSAAHLLKHKFFKLTVKDPQGLVRNLWANVPENVQAPLSVLPLPLEAPHVKKQENSMHHGQGSGWLSQDLAVHGGSELPETMDAAYGIVLVKRLLLHHVLHPEAHDLEKAPMEDVLSKCGQESTLPWLMASAISMCKGLFIGVGEMRGLGLQHLHGMGFLMGRIMGDDGLPVWSGPSYLEIASSRSGVGAGRIRTEIVHILANNFTLEKFKRQKRLAGSELALTDFDEDMSVEDIREFMRKAQADEAHSYVLALRAREGTTLSLLRLYGYAQPDHEANKQIYGKAVTPSDILEGRVPPPSAFSFRGFSQLVDDLHVLEHFGMSEPPMFQRKRSQPRWRWHAYDTVRGFHRFGSNKS